MVVEKAVFVKQSRRTSAWLVLQQRTLNINFVDSSTVKSSKLSFFQANFQFTRHIFSETAFFGDP
jgi:hypothetical protein